MRFLALAGFVIGVVLAVGDDDVIHEVDAHQCAGMLDALGQFPVGTAGSEAAGGVVVADGKDGGIGEDGLTDDDADIEGIFGGEDDLPDYLK